MRPTAETSSRAVLLIWGAAAIACVGLLMVNHTVALPGPTLAVTQRAARDLVGARSRQVIHVIPAACSCTQQLFDHLIARTPRVGWTEHIVYPGPRADYRSAAEAAGFVFHAVRPEAVVLKLGVTAGPVMLVVGDEGTLTWAGGYYRTPALVRPQDERILAALPRPPDPLPIFGCAIDPSLAVRLDPLGFRYW